MALRASVLVKQPLTLTYRDVELAFTNSPEAPYAIGQVESMLRDSLASGNADIDRSVKPTTAISGSGNCSRQGSAADMPDFDCLVNVLKAGRHAGIRNLTSGQTSGADTEGMAGQGPVPVRSHRRGRVGAGSKSRGRTSRLERVCEYLERHEPSNPAALFARRAQRNAQHVFPGHHA